MTEREIRGDRFAEIEELYAGYTVYDTHYEKLGNVDDIFVDENDRPEYIGVKMGFLGLKSTLIPWDMVRVNEKRRLMEVSEPKDRIKDAPTFDGNEEVTPEAEERVHRHFGLQRSGGPQRSAYGAYYRDADHSSHTTVGSPEDTRGNLSEPRERRTSREHERTTGRGSDLAPGDEVTVQRSEEELRAGTREREAGAMRVRKRVQTAREQVRVPRRREEVSVERTPVEGRREAASEAGFGEAEVAEDEIVVPVIEEEIVVEKRPVVKEEIRIRKDVVEDEEVIEEDVRKEEVEIDDQTRYRDR